MEHHSDWYTADDSVIAPMVKATAEKYAAEKKITPTRLPASVDDGRLRHQNPERRRQRRLFRSRASGTSWNRSAAILTVNNIEVVYDHVILVLKGVSLRVPRAAIVALLGANGAGKTTTLKAISNLLRAERGEVTKGSIVFDGAEVHGLSPNDLVRRGCIQVMEGRRCFGHLTVEENLLTGAFTRRDGKAAIARRSRSRLRLFPAAEGAPHGMAGYTSGGEQQMCAIGRALMSRPKMILLDEPSMGLAPQIVEEIFDIVKDLNATRRRLVPARRAEHQHGAALRQLRLYPGERPRRARRRGEGARATTRTSRNSISASPRGGANRSATSSITSAANAGWL